MEIRAKYYTGIADFALRREKSRFANYAARDDALPYARLVRVVNACAIRDASTCARSVHAVSCSAGLVTTRHARHNGANLFNLTNNKLIS